LVFLKRTTVSEKYFTGTNITLLLSAKSVKLALEFLLFRVEIFLKSFAKFYGLML